MAYTSVESNPIPEGTQYYRGKLPLGDYDFSLSVDALADTTDITATCALPNEKTATKTIHFSQGSAALQWRVEANESVATVYATVRRGSVPGVNKPLNTVIVSNGQIVSSKFGSYVWRLSRADMAVAIDGYECIRASDKPSTETYDYMLETPSGRQYVDRGRFDRQYTFRGKTVYYHRSLGMVGESSKWMYPGIELSADFGNGGRTAWAMIYGIGDDVKEYIIARFAINLGDAGGYPGGGGGWVSPGDWNPDPTTTLHLTVNGALSGRHNDPLADPSYSYVPADKATVKDYGSGGDGGNGGGGGAGASTIIVRQFATNKANSKDILALAKRHGYGSGGGKGGKGGDGCILIYY